jgi:hypothetical protein
MSGNFENTWRHDHRKAFTNSDNSGFFPIIGYDAAVTVDVSTGTAQYVENLQATANVVTFDQPRTGDGKQIWDDSSAGARFCVTQLGALSTFSSGIQAMSTVDDCSVCSHFDVVNLCAKTIGTCHSYSSITCTKPDPITTGVDYTASPGSYDGGALSGSSQCKWDECHEACDNNDDCIGWHCHDTADTCYIMPTGASFTGANIHTYTKFTKVQNGCATEANMAAPHDGVVACAATGTGPIGSAFSEVCADGWAVCTGQQIFDSAITHSESRSFAGCYKYDAAHDCTGCGSTCASKQAAVGAGSPCFGDDASGANVDVAGMGGACIEYTTTGDSCIAGGRSDFDISSQGCDGEVGSGVMCCRA